MTQQPQPNATRTWMRILTSPSYVLAIMLGLVFPIWKPWSFFVVAVAVMIVVRIVYLAALWRFVKGDGRPPARFIVCSMGIQLVMLVIAAFLLSQRA